jgi:hypothetical protein
LFDGDVDGCELPLGCFGHQLERSVLPDEFPWLTDGDGRASGASGPEPGASAHENGEHEQKDEKPYECAHGRIIARRRSSCVIAELAAEFLVLEAHELDQIRVGQQALIDTYRPRLRVGLGIVNGDVDLEAAEVRPAQSLDDLPSEVSGAPFTSSRPRSRN